MGSFNPYRVWLDLNESITSPNHFQLLGLDESEQDSKAIAAAADRAASKVRRFRPGEHAALWAALLDQIAEAKRCLTDPQQRFEYCKSLGLTEVSGPSKPKPNFQGSAQSRVDPNMYPPGLAPAMSPVNGPTAVDAVGTPAAAPFQEPWSPPQSVAPTSMPQANPPPSSPQFQPFASPYSPVGGPSNGAMHPNSAAMLPMSPAGVPYLQPADPSGLSDPMHPAIPGAGLGSGSLAMAPVPNYSAVPPLPAHADPMAALPIAVPPAVAGPMSPAPMPLNPMAPIPAAATPVGTPGPASAMPAAQPLGLGAQPYPMAKPIPMAPSQNTAPMAEPALAVRNSSAILLAQRNQGSGVALLMGLAVGLLILSMGGAYFWFTSQRDKANEEIASTDPTSSANSGVASDSSAASDPSDDNPASSTNTAAATPSTKSFDNDLTQALGSGSSARGSNNSPPTSESAEPATAMVKGSNSETSKIPDSPTPEPSKPNEPTKPTETPQPDSKPAPDTTAKTPSPETPAVTDVLPKPTKEDLVKLGRAMTKAREAISEHEFDRADAFVAVASEMPRQSEHQDMLDRLKLLSESVKNYRNAIQTSIGKLSAGSSFNVGEAAVGVVETGPDKVIFRVNGQNRSYNIKDLPVGLAAALAAQTLPESDPNTLMLKGAYVMASPRATPDDLKKAREFLEKGAESVDAAKELLLLFDDKYELTLPPDK